MVRYSRAQGDVLIEHGLEVFTGYYSNGWYIPALLSLVDVEKVLLQVTPVSARDSLFEKYKSGIRVNINLLRVARKQIRIDEEALKARYRHEWASLPPSPFQGALWDKV